MADKITVIPFSGKEITERLTYVQTNMANIEANLAAINANTAADTEFKQMVEREYATQNYVDGKISELMGEAVPETLDTLKEIADALNDNATMTMVSEAISTKANSDDVYTKSEIDMKGYLTEHQSLDNYYTKDEVNTAITSAQYDDTNIIGRIEALETKEDKDTVYNDEEVRGLIADLTERVNNLPTEDTNTVYDDEEVRALIEALTGRVATLEGKDIQNYDDTEVRGLINALAERMTAEENKEDQNTVYDDEEVRGLITSLSERITEVEGREDQNTVYDDEEVRNLIAALTERVDALPTEDTNTVYDDEEVRGLITALTERVDALPTEDTNTVYDDEEVRGLINALTERLTAEENKEDKDTVYNDEEVRALISDLTARMVTQEAREDKDTVYDDSELQNKYNSLNTKYNELFNFVYSGATPEQATMLNATVVNNAFENGETSVEITNGELGNVTIPETTKGLTVEAPMQEGATITLSSPKYMYLNNTSETPVSVTIDSPEPTGSSSNTTIYAGGEYDTITLNNASLNVNSKLNELQVENVVVENTAEEPKSNSVTAVFVGENPSVSSETATTLTINNKNAASSDENVNDTPNMTINAPKATVTLNNSWDNVASTVGDNTLIIGTNARINKLTVLKGNVIVKDTVTTRCINEVVNETENYTVDVYRKNVKDGAELRSSLISNCGYTILDADITCSRLTWGILGSGNYVLDLNGHTLTISDKMLGLMTRHTVNLTIIDSVGTGKFISEKSYGLWAGDNSTITINVPETTEIIGVTHTLYCEGSGKPHINVIGGTYKMIVGEDETDIYDVNGNYKFMLNHLDSTYNREGNCFTITGGRFVGFDPSRMYGDPYTDPVTGEHYYSMVDLNEYEVLTENTQIDGMNVYKVVKK